MTDVYSYERPSLGRDFDPESGLSRHGVYGGRRHGHRVARGSARRALREQRYSLPRHSR